MSGTSRQAALSARPVKNRWVEEEWRDDGLVRLVYETELKPWFARLSGALGQDRSMRREKKLELDQMGSAVWRLIDGQRDVSQLAAELATLYGLHRREAETATTVFLRQLGQRGLIGLV